MWYAEIKVIHLRIRMYNANPRNNSQSAAKFRIGKSSSTIM